MERAKIRERRNPSGESARHEEQGHNPFPILRELSTILEENKVRICLQSIKGFSWICSSFYYNRLDFKFLPSLYMHVLRWWTFFSLSPFTFDRNGSVMPMEHALEACLIPLNGLTYSNATHQSHSKFRAYADSCDIVWICSKYANFMFLVNGHLTATKTIPFKSKIQKMISH